MKLKINDREKQISLNQLEKQFGPGSEFEEKNGYCVDFSKPLEFRLNSTFFRNDEHNPGKLLAPRNYTIPTKYNRENDGVTDEIVYYERIGRHSYGKGASSRTIDVTEPGSIVIKNGRFTLDLTSQGTRNYALAYFLLNHPKLGYNFYYYNEDAEANRLINLERKFTKINSMLLEAEHPQYLDDESVRSLAKKAQIPGSDNIGANRLRMMLLDFSKSKDPNKGVQVLLNMLVDTKEYQFISTVREAMDYGVLHYNADVKQFFYCEFNPNRVAVRSVDSSAPLYTVKDHEATRPVEAFASWLINTDRNGNSTNILHLLNKEKERIKARQVAAGKKNAALKPDSFSVEFVQ